MLFPKEIASGFNSEADAAVTLPIEAGAGHEWPCARRQRLFPSGQNGLSCVTCPTTLCPAVAMTTVSGLKLEHTYPYWPSGEKIVMPGPFGTVTRVFSLNVLPSR